MAELEHKEDLIAKLKEAAQILYEASQLATVTEDGRIKLYGAYALLIGGLSEAVGDLAAIVEGEL
jgi:hypothetical protein